MSLQAELDAQKEEFKQKVDRETVARMQRATAELEESGILEDAPRSGDQLPDFILPDSTGIMVRSRDLRAKGPLVVSFFRGGW